MVSFAAGEPGRAALPAAYFDRSYSESDDPWGFTSRWYEERKRAISLAALPQRRYGQALEVGCSIGVLTEQLATRCDRLLAIDVAQHAVDRARTRLAGHDHVVVELGDVTREYPPGAFDLVVLSEVGYYFDRVTLASVVGAVIASLTAGGTLLACHWRHPVTDYPLSGDAVHAAIGARTELSRVVEHREEDFLLEVFSLDGRSVARRSGLL